MITRDAIAKDGTVRVTFTTRDHHQAPISVVGDFNGWDPHATPMTAGADVGLLSAVVELPVGQRHNFRYLAAGDRWFNDEAADDYVPNGHGGHDSVVDLTYVDAATDPADPATARTPAPQSPRATRRTGRSASQRQNTAPAPEPPDQARLPRKRCTATPAAPRS
jgi:1,4-alpha-glucan branching enzyme